MSHHRSLLSKLPNQGREPVPSCKAVPDTAPAAPLIQMSLLDQMTKVLLEKGARLGLFATNATSNNTHF